MTDNTTDLMPTDQELETIEAQQGDVTTQADALVVATEVDLSTCSVLLTGIAALRKQVAEVFDPPVQAAHEAHKAALAARKKVEQPLVQAEATVKRKAAQFHTEQKRLADEARRKEAARLRKLEEERRLADAVRLEDQGKATEAEAVLATPAPTPAPVITTPPPPKVQGMSTRTVRSAKVVSLLDLAQYAASCPEYLYVLVPVQKHLDALARQHKVIKDGEQLLPGVVVVETVNVARR